MEGVSYSFFLSLAIIIFGFFLKKVKILSIADGRVLSKLIINVTLPAVILTTVTQISLSISYAVMPMIALGYSGIVLLSGFIMFRKVPSEKKGIMLISIITFNVGNFAYPLLESIWGVQAVEYAAMFDIGNAIMIFSVCYLIAAFYSPKVQPNNPSPQSSNEINEAMPPPKKKKKLKQILITVSQSIPLWCYFIGLFLNIINLNFPAPLHDFLSIIAKGNTVLVLLCLGLFLDFAFDKNQWKMILQVLGIRYLFGLLCGIILFYILPFDLFMRQMLMILLILPVGMSIIPYAVEFEYNERALATICNLSIIISFPIMWIMSLLFEKMI